jgi:hypothetical protein
MEEASSPTTSPTGHTTISFDDESSSRPSTGQHHESTNTDPTEVSEVTKLLGLGEANGPEGVSIADKIMTGTVTRRNGNPIDKDAPGIKVNMSLTDLFAGDQQVVYLLEDASTIGLHKIKQMRITVKCDRKLLSDPYARVLNPLVITFQQARMLPSTPVAFTELDEKCNRSTIEFRAFQGAPCRLVADSKKHGVTQTWNQKHVVLTEQFSFEEMVRFLNSSIPIEVHDRDRLGPKGLPSTALFEAGKAEDFNDYWNAVGKSKGTNVLKDVTDRWDPCGVARLDLRDLLSGVRIMEYELPILAGPRISELKNPDALIGAMHAGHYVETGANLTVGVSLYRPVTSVQTRMSFVAAPSPSSNGAVTSRMHRSFGRVVYLWNGGYGARFSTETYTRGCYWFPRLPVSTARLKRTGV